MTNEEIQRELTSRGLYTLRIDGILGKRSMEGIEKALKRAGVNFSSWSDRRMQIAFEQLVYRDAKIEVGLIDGLVGQQTRYARSVWEARKNGDKLVETWRNTPPPIITSSRETSKRWPLQKDMRAFYGEPGTGHRRLELPCPFRIAWEPAKTITSVMVHQKCYDAFGTIWHEAYEFYGPQKFKELRLDMYGGCYNNRAMRGGSALSTHAFACAWDVDPDRNQLKWTRRQASLDDTPYTFFWEIVFKQGGVSLGHESDFDWMHFQFARTR